MNDDVAIVAIGRNEGKRLKQCLIAALANCSTVVYVDSGSTDGSVSLARELGAHVVELDLTTPFTAARARNEGAARVAAINGAVRFLQFVDGDCELVPGWIPAARAFLETDPTCAIACGRRRERYPEASVYNRLCDMEWDTPVGPARECGGDAMIVCRAFDQVGGYDPSVIAGEEPEMCFRLRQRGWTIHRLDQEMALHDAAMTRFGQWWKRNLRAGHAYAEGNWRHGGPPEHFWRKNVISNFVWGNPIGWLFWPLLWLRVRRTSRSGVYATFITLSKAPQLAGQVKFYVNRLMNRRPRLIEYKS